MADWTTVAEGDDVPAGEMIEVDNRGEPLVIARAAGGLYAFEGWCTHEECPLSQGQLTEHRLECYCHGAVFDAATGAVVQGPARRSLAAVPVVERNGVLYRTT